MGQASLAVLNKVGNSMYWQDAWDSKFSYTKLFNFKRFFLKFFKFFFEDIFHLETNILKLRNKNKYFLEFLVFSTIHLKSQNQYGEI